MEIILPNIGILGTGSYTPRTKITNEDLTKIVNTSDEWIRQRTGIIQRFFSSKEENVYVMGSIAALKAFHDANSNPNDINEIIFATNGTGEKTVPSAASITQYLIGANNASCYDVAMGCTGGLRAIECAYGSILKKHLVNGIPNPKILMIAGDTLSSVLDFQDRTTCVLLGDGAGALVLGIQDEPGVIAVDTYSRGSSEIFYNSNLRTGSGLEAVFGERSSESNDTKHLFRQDGREVFKFAIRAIEEVVRETSFRLSITPEEFYHIMHQANLRIIETAAERLGLPKEKVYTDGIVNEGNTSGASYIIGLDRAVKSEKIKLNDLVALTAVGAGLSWGICALRWTKTTPSSELTPSIDGLFARYKLFEEGTKKVEMKIEEDKGRSSV